MSFNLSQFCNSKGDCLLDLNQPLSQHVQFDLESNRTAAKPSHYVTLVDDKTFAELRHSTKQSRLTYFPAAHITSRNIPVIKLVGITDSSTPKTEKKEQKDENNLNNPSESQCGRCNKELEMEDDANVRMGHSICDVCLQAHCQSCFQKHLLTICSGCYTAYHTGQTCICYHGQGGPGAMGICDKCWPEWDRTNPPRGEYASPYSNRTKVKEAWEHNVAIWRKRTGHLDTVLKEPNYSEYRV